MCKGCNHTAPRGTFKGSPNALVFDSPNVRASKWRVVFFFPHTENECTGWCGIKQHYRKCHCSSCAFPIAATMQKPWCLRLDFFKKKRSYYFSKKWKTKKKTILDFPVKIQCLILVSRNITFSHSLILRTLFPLKMLHHILNTASYITACQKVLAGFKTAWCTHFVSLVLT